MGILKHGVLPTLAAVHLFTFGTMYYKGAEGFLEKFMPDKYKKEGKTTEIEKHLTYALGGSQVVMCVNAIVACCMENAHYRGMAIILESIYWSNNLFLGAKGKGDTRPLKLMTLLSFIGLGVHAMEPGIFTKDKAAK